MHFVSSIQYEFPYSLNFRWYGFVMFLLGLIQQSHPFVLFFVTFVLNCFDIT